MAKITFIGAGSFEFTRNLVRDVLTFPTTQDATICLMDIDAERLEYSTRAVKKIIAQGNYPATVIATRNRVEALDGADAVLCTILNGSVSVWRHDIEIPKKYGVDTNIGDTRSVSGMFRALRTIPVMLDICHDMERVCPRAILLNYTNPMSMLCRAMQRETSVQVTGLCHSVQHTSEMLAHWIGAPYPEIDYVCAGINHQAWYLKFLWKGEDAYPLIREAVEIPENSSMEIVRNELYRHFGFYVTESSGHNSEYNPWFRKRPDLIEKYCAPGTGWNPGKYAYALDYYLGTEKNWKQDIIDWLRDDNIIDLARGHEYAAAIISAYLGGDPFEFNGNVPNTGLIPNLPEQACIEIPVLANRRGFNPMYVGALPPQLAALNDQSIAVEEMAVEAAINGDPRMVFHAVAYDPLTAAVCSLEEIRDMVQEMLEKNADYLPQFKHLDVGKS